MFFKKGLFKIEKRVVTIFKQITTNLYYIKYQQHKAENALI